MSVDNYSHLETATLVGRRPLTMTRHRIIFHAPEFEKRLSGEDTVHEGSTATFGCKVIGFPKPSLRWLKDDAEIIDHERIRVELDDDGNCEVTLDCVNKGDEAAYRCEAENREGRSASTFYLTVRGKKRRKHKKSKSPNRRLVSHSPLIATIAEKVDEERLEERSAPICGDPLLTSFYRETTVNTRLEPPKFLGQWAFADGDDNEDQSDLIDSDEENYEGGVLICNVVDKTDEIIYTSNDRVVQMVGSTLNISSDETETSGEFENGDACNNHISVNYDENRVSTSCTDDPVSLRHMIAKISHDFDILAENEILNQPARHDTFNRTHMVPSSAKKNKRNSISIFTQYHVNIIFFLCSYVFLGLYFDIGSVKFLLNILFVFVLYNSFGT